jgi:RNA recognition motif-containing protein
MEEEQTEEVVNNSELPAKLFVGQLPKQMTKEELNQLFVYYGYTVIDANIQVDLKTNISKGIPHHNLF